MRRTGISKTIIIVGLIVCLCSLTVGYAVLRSSLSINGVATLDPVSFGVELTDITQDSVTNDAIVVSTGNLDKTTIENINVKFMNPGSSATFKVDLENKGDLDVNLSIVDMIVPVCSSTNQEEADVVCSHIKITLFDRDRNIIATLKNSNPSFTVTNFGGLVSKATDTVYVKIEYEEESINDLSTTTVSVNNIGLTLTYVQDKVIAGLINPDKNSSSYKTLKMLGISEVKSTPVDYNMFNYSPSGLDANYIETSETSVFNYDRGNAGIFEMEDDFGISYYYRGNDSINNYVKFGNYAIDMYYWQDDNVYKNGSLDECVNSTGSNSSCNLIANAGDSMYWRIVRINGTGSIRLYYEGNYNNTEKNYSKEGMGQSKFNNLPEGYENITETEEVLNITKYMGYTYDNSAPDAQDGTSSEIKQYLESWYQKSGISSLNDYIKNEQFYEDANNLVFSEEVVDLFKAKEPLLSGVDNISAYVYSSFYNKLHFGDNIITPSLKTVVADKNYGGIYNLKIGLITLDEMILSGQTGLLGVTLDKTYINNYSHSMSPVGIFSIPQLKTEMIMPQAMDFSDYNSLLFDGPDFPSTVNGVINLSTDNLLLLSGDGSFDNPYTFNVG